MPCNSDYMNATNREMELSLVYGIRDVLNKGGALALGTLAGYHPDVYNKNVSKEAADAVVAEVCARLKAMDTTTLPLRVQIWWEEHQKTDAARIQVERVTAQLRSEQEVALAKLTPRERHILGL